MRSNRTQSGFSLIEAVVYIALFILLSVTTMTSLFDTVRAFNHLHITRDINDTSVLIMERLTYDIKRAISIDMANSTFGTTPGRLTLSVMNASGTPMTVEYYVQNNLLRVRESGVDKGALVFASTQIDGLVFSLINTGNTTGVKTALHLRSSRGGLSFVDHFYNTSMLRGTY